MITGSKIILRSKLLDDALNDYAWQTDDELSHLDAARPLDINFMEYFSVYKRQLRYPSLISHQFAIETPDGNHIGNCSFYHFDENKSETELGIMIGNRHYWDKCYGTDAINTLVNHIFSQTSIKHIYLKTLDSNIRAQKCFHKCGFTKYGHSAMGVYKFTLMEIYRSNWEKQQQKT
ncbi:MAG: GNAT family N-acetyltransferase [Dehalococcoidales bacterium]|nr:GNAT family N-acetyltransferase [Dehalococcoidales bacterium]